MTEIITKIIITKKGYTPIVMRLMHPHNWEMLAYVDLYGAEHWIKEKSAKEVDDFLRNLPEGCVVEPCQEYKTKI